MYQLTEKELIYSTQEFRRGKSSDFPSDKCLICLSNLVSKVLKCCKHIVCHFCVKKMQELKLDCPLCLSSLDCYEMSMYILSTSSFDPITEFCLNNFLTSMANDSSNSLLNGYTIVTVVGAIPKPDFFTPFHNISGEPVREWDHFIFFLNNKMATLKGHYSDGSELSEWNRCAIYKCRNILFIHYGILMKWRTKFN